MNKLPSTMNCLHRRPVLERSDRPQRRRRLGLDSEEISEKENLPPGPAITVKRCAESMPAKSGFSRCLTPTIRREFNEAAVALTSLLLVMGLSLAQGWTAVADAEKKPEDRERFVEVSEPASRAPRPAARPDKPALELISAPQTIHGGVKIPTMVATSEFMHFSFIPPHAWRVQSEPASKRIHLVDSGTGSLITLQILEETRFRDSLPEPELLRARVLARYPGRKILAELTVSGMGGTGSGFDLDWRTSDGSGHAVRAVFVPFPGGVLECTLITPAKYLEQSQRHLNQLLLSLRSAPRDGKLELPPVTPE